jgi:hypothetical protein
MSHRLLTVAAAFTLFALASAAPVRADSVSVGDTLKLSTQSPMEAPPGFDVSRYSGPDSYTGGPFKIANQTSGDEWISFCIERGESVSNGGEYRVKSIGKQTSGGAPLTSAAAWLYEQFRLGGNFAGYDFGGGAFNRTNGEHTRLLQFALWLSMGFEAPVAGQALLNLATGQTQVTGTVRIVQLEEFVEGRWVDRQDQLALVPVPEPTTLLMLGLGLVGLGGTLRRRRSR